MSTIDNTTLGIVASDGESFYARLTAVTAYVLKTGNATLNGIVVNSHTSGTIEIRNGTNYLTGTVAFGTITLAAGDRFIPFFGARFPAGLIVSCGGTIDITVMYK